MTTASISKGHIFGVMHYKKRKFGQGSTAWLAFEHWLNETIGRTCPVNELTDAESRLVIDTMKTLPDVVPEGQETLF